MDETKIKVKSLYKALHLLDYFAEKHTSLSVSAVAEQENLPKSTVHNIFSTFAAYGLLSRDDNNGHYELGPKIAYLSNIYFSTNSSFSLIHAEIERVSSIANENVYFGTLFENQVLYLDAMYASSMNRTSTIIGVVAPLYCTGVGKSLLAWSDPSVLDNIFSAPVTKFTENTITDRKVLETELEQIHAQGYSVDNMEHEYGVKCVAVPIFRSDNSLFGAISISCPSLRMENKQAEFAALLQSAQQNLLSFL